jgi:hypothetical protein
MGQLLQDLDDKEESVACCRLSARRWEKSKEKSHTKTDGTLTAEMPKRACARARASHAAMSARASSDSGDCGARRTCASSVMAKSVAAGIWRLQVEGGKQEASVAAPQRVYLSGEVFFFVFLAVVSLASFDGRTLSPAGSHIRDTASGAKLLPSAPAG